MSHSIEEITKVEELGQTQQTALAALKGGKSFPQAAEVAGVSRATVYRWVQTDPHFRAAYNQWQQEQAESARARVLGLADKAVQVVDKALDRQDEKVAMGMLKHLGAMRRPDRGATDPEVVQLQMDLAREREKYLALVGMAKHLLTKAGLSPSQQQQYLREHGTSQLPGHAEEGRKLLADHLRPDELRADQLLADRPPLDMSMLEQILQQGESELTEDETSREMHHETPHETSQGVSHALDEETNAQVS